MYEIVSSVSGAMGTRVRRERAGPEKVMHVLGAQEWFRWEVRGERERPGGERGGVVRVCVFVRISGWGEG